MPHFGERSVYLTRPFAGCEGDLKDKNQSLLDIMTYWFMIAIINSSTFSVHPCIQTFVVVYAVAQRVSLESGQLGGDKSMLCSEKHFYSEPCDVIDSGKQCFTNDFNLFKKRHFSPLSWLFETELYFLLKAQVFRSANTGCERFTCSTRIW